MTLPIPQTGPPVIKRADDEVHSVTVVQTPLSQEQKARTRRYLISMSIRTVCFLGAVAAQGWWRWLLLAGAALLPYVAVVMANAGREDKPIKKPQPVTPVALPQLEHQVRPIAP